MAKRSCSKVGWDGRKQIHTPLPPSLQAKRSHRAHLGGLPLSGGGSRKEAPQPWRRRSPDTSKEGLHFRHWGMGVAINYSAPLHGRTWLKWGAGQGRALLSDGTP